MFEFLRFATKPVSMEQADRIIAEETARAAACDKYVAVCEQALARAIVEHQTKNGPEPLKELKALELARTDQSRQMMKLESARDIHSKSSAANAERLAVEHIAACDANLEAFRVAVEKVDADVDQLYDSLQAAYAALARFLANSPYRIGSAPAYVSMGYVSAMFVRCLNWRLRMIPGFRDTAPATLSEEKARWAYYVPFTPAKAAALAAKEAAALPEKQRLRAERDAAMRRDIYGPTIAALAGPIPAPEEAAPAAPNVAIKRVRLA